MPLLLNLSLCSCLIRSVSVLYLSASIPLECPNFQSFCERMMLFLSQILRICSGTQCVGITFKFICLTIVLGFFLLFFQSIFFWQAPSQTACGKWMPKCRQLKNNLNKGAKYGECVFGLHPQGVNAQQCILDTYSLMLRKLNLDEREHWPFKLFPFLSLKPSLIYENQWALWL